MTSKPSRKASGSLLDSQEVAREQKRKMSDPDIIHVGDSKTRSQPIAIPSAAVSPIVSPHTDGKWLVKVISKITCFIFYLNTGIVADVMRVGYFNFYINNLF